MAEGYYADFREYVGALERHGKLHRWSRAVNKDTELMPLMGVAVHDRHEQDRRQHRQQAHEPKNRGSAIAGSSVVVFFECALVAVERTSDCGH